VLASGPPPDVILLDLLMPVMDGQDVLDWLRGTPAATVPVILTTGSARGAEFARAYNCAGFLKKPFDADDLIAELDRVVDPTGT
jgi:CheY-like chemotaxis protein